MSWQLMASTAGYRNTGSYEEICLDWALDVLYMNCLSMPFIQVASEEVKFLAVFIFNIKSNVFYRKITIFQVFVTHGGLLSTMEAIHSQTVVVGIPFANDQENMC